MKYRYREPHEMKDSGVEWLGIIPREWEVSKISQHFLVRSEKVSDTEYSALSVSKKGIVPQMESVAKTDNNDNRKKVCVNDFVINSRADRKGSCGVSKLEGSVSLISHVLKPLKTIEPNYIHYLFRNYYFSEEFFRWGTGIVADLWSTNIERMKKINIPVFDLNNQQKIADFLDLKCGEFDSIIEKKESLITKLEEAKKSLISEVVTGKVKVIEKENGSYEIGKREPHEMKDSGVEWLGMIPREWEVTAIKNIANLGDKTLSEKEDQNLEIKYLDIGNVNSKGEILEWQDFKFKDAPSRARKILFEEDIIVSTVRTYLRAMAYITNIEENSICSTGFAILKARKDKIINKYLYYIVFSNMFVEEVVRNSTGVSYPAITSTKIMDLKVCNSLNKDEQQKIADFLDLKCSQFDSTIEKQKELIEKLKKAKQSLISEAVTGKIEVL